VLTVAGSTVSPTVGYVLADTPTAPATAPTSDAAITSSSLVKVDMAIVPSDGGSPVLSYSLEVDKGDGFYALYGVTSDSLSLTYTLSSTTRGQVYKFRYRARNAVGWSGYSPIGYVTSADKPTAPPSPTFMSATQTTIVWGLSPSTDDGGSPITSYELQRDDGLGGTFTTIGAYDGISQTYTLDQGVDGTLVTGRTYRVQYRAVNAIGNSEYSEVAYAAMARLPAQAATPTKVSAHYSKTWMLIEWAANTDLDPPGGAVTGYKVLMDDGLNGAFEEIYYG